MRRVEFARGCRAATATAARRLCRGAVTFDVRAPESRTTKRRSREQRVAALDHVPLLLGSAHLVSARSRSCFMSAADFCDAVDWRRSSIPLLVALACDAAALACCCCASGSTIAAEQRHAGALRAGLARPARCGACSAMPPPTCRASSGSAILPLLIGAGLAAGAVVSITSPPLAMVMRVGRTGGGGAVQHATGHSSSASPP